MKRNSRILACLIALCMLTALLPLAALAEDANTPTLTIWCAFENNAAKSVSNYADLPLYQELQKRLGVKLVFQHPPTGMEADQFKLLVASKDLPDIIEYDWFTQYPKGPQRAIDDGVIIPLNEYMEAGLTPNLSAKLGDDPELDASVKTYTGNYYVFPFIRDTALMEQKGGGITVRKDVLDSLGLEVPTTIAEWEAAFEKMQQAGFEHPFTAIFKDLHTNDSTWVGAWGIAYGFYQVDGEVRFGQVQPEYRQYLETMARWFEKGYIDPDLLTNDNAALDGKMTSGSAAVTYRSPDSGIGVWTKAMRPANPDVMLVAAPYPTLEKGETRYIAQPNYRYQAAYSAAITTSCKDVELALKVLDYAYSPEGQLLYNFGVEGVSFEYDENGEPQFTDLIKNNPDGLTLKEAMILYCRNTSGGPFEKAVGPIISQRTYQEQLDAPIIWFKSVDWSRSLPRIVYSGEESAEYATIMNEINVLTEEMTVKIMIGDKPLESFDSYVESIEKAGVARAVEIVQTALDRQNGK
ncbi:extracellular solute-binding protein [Beduinella massiliensis]|uniref:extracellular solute-binding protein n=1 Tax=Beduinella massiliensis TaxID=1852363 RepID=UPI000C8195DD